MPLSPLAFAAILLVASSAASSMASPADDEKIVADLDTEYQAAVKTNDAATIDRIVANDFVLVTGRGRTVSKAELLAEAREKTAIYERQEDSDRTVRVWGDSAMVTALLWVKGTKEGKPFEYRLWFSDLYIHRPEGWRYVFAQASLRMPEEP